MKDKQYVCKVKVREEAYVELPEELKYEPGQKFSIKEYNDGSFLLVPYKRECFDIDESLFLALAKMAHEKDMTLNDFVNEVLKDAIERMEMDKDFEEMETSSEDFEEWNDEAPNFNP